LSWASPPVFRVPDADEIGHGLSSPLLRHLETIPEIGDRDDRGVQPDLVVLVADAGKLGPQVPGR
jgi:hypothetical protein